MTQPEEREPTHRPVEGEDIAFLGYYLGVTFYPHIKLEKKSGLEFAASLSEYVDPQDVELESNQWRFSATKGGLSIAVGPSSLQLRGIEPTHRQEWYEERYRVVLNRFQERFRPELILESKAMIRGLIPVDGDARFFLGSHLMNMDPKRLDPLGRPLHVLGLRIFFPPYEELPESENGQSKVTEWGVNVKVESWIEDPSKLWLEADAAWRTPQKWDEGSVEKVVGRLNTLADYLEERIVEFLQHKSDEGEDE